MFQEQILPWLNTLLDTADGPVFIGIDGRSGSGKSTLAGQVQAELGTDIVTVIEGDQFYAGGSAETWDARSAEEKAANVIDWRRQLDALTELRACGTATWYPFDWEADDWDSDEPLLAATPEETTVTALVILEGAYSCRPELHDVLDKLVLLDPPRDVRRGQLLAREGDAYRADWEARWSEAEELYFGRIMTEDRFDLVLRD